MTIIGMFVAMFFFRSMLGYAGSTQAEAWRGRAGGAGAVERNYVGVLAALGRQLRLRATVTATAQTYFWRFFRDRAFSAVRAGQQTPECHPDWMAPSCLSLACKVEECPLLDPHVLKNAVLVVTKDPTLHFGFDVRSSAFMERIVNNEFVLLEGLQAQLVVFHPYQDVQAFAADFAESSGVDHAQVMQLTELSWNIVNDSYRCPACLLYTPYDIALAALFIAAESMNLLEEKRASEWWIKLEHEYADMKSCMKFILDNAYEPPDDVSYVEKLCVDLYAEWHQKLRMNAEKANEREEEDDEDDEEQSAKRRKEEGGAEK